MWGLDLFCFKFFDCFGFVVFRRNVNLLTNLIEDFILNLICFSFVEVEFVLVKI